MKDSSFEQEESEPHKKFDIVPNTESVVLIFQQQ